MTRRFLEPFAMADLNRRAAALRMAWNWAVKGSAVVGHANCLLWRVRSRQFLRCTVADDQQAGWPRPFEIREGAALETLSPQFTLVLAEPASRERPHRSLSLPQCRASDRGLIEGVIQLPHARPSAEKSPGPISPET
jgi:hypothetical protein